MLFVYSVPPSLPTVFEDAYGSRILFGLKIPHRSPLLIFRAHFPLFSSYSNLYLGKFAIKIASFICSYNFVDL